MGWDKAILKPAPSLKKISQTHLIKMETHSIRGGARRVSKKTHLITIHINDGSHKHQHEHVISQISIFVYHHFLSLSLIMSNMRILGQFLGPFHLKAQFSLFIQTQIECTLLC